VLTWDDHLDADQTRMVLDRVAPLHRAFLGQPPRSLRAGERARPLRAAPHGRAGRGRQRARPRPHSAAGSCSRSRWPPTSRSP
jgi:hypothetical protein